MATLSVDIRASKIHLPIFIVSVYTKDKVFTDDEIRGWFIKSNSFSTYKTSGALLICEQQPDPNGRNDITYRMIVLQPWRNEERRRQYRQMAETPANRQQLQALTPDLHEDTQEQGRQQQQAQLRGGGGGGGGFRLGRPTNIQRVMRREIERQVERTRFLNEASVRVPGPSWFPHVLIDPRYDDDGAMVRFRIAFRENCGMLLRNYVRTSTEGRRIFPNIAWERVVFRNFVHIQLDERSPGAGPHVHGVCRASFPEGNSPSVGILPQGRQPKRSVIQARDRGHQLCMHVAQVTCVVSMNLVFTNHMTSLSDMIGTLGILYEGFGLLFSKEKYKSSYSKAGFYFNDNRGQTLLSRLTGERPPDKTFDLLYVCYRYAQLNR